MNIPSVLIIISAVLGLYAAVPYIRDVWRGKTIPAIASWIAWSALFGVGSASAATVGQLPTTANCGACSLGAATIALLSIRRGNRSLSKYDIWCLAGAIAGLCLLVIAKSPVLSIAALVSTDGIAYIPTARNIIKHPFEETLSTYVYSAIAALAAFMAAALLRHYNFTSITYPVYLVAADSSAALIIAISRKRLTGKEAPECQKNTSKPEPGEK
jgi:hypothetical protein